MTTNRSRDFGALAGAIAVTLCVSPFVVPSLFHRSTETPAPPAPTIHPAPIAEPPKPPAPVAAALPTPPTHVSCSLSNGPTQGNNSVSSGGMLSLAAQEHLLAVSDPDANAVVTVSLQQQQARIERRISVGRMPGQVLLAPSGTLYVAERGSNTLSAYDPRDGRKLCSIAVPAEPFGLAITGNEDTILVTSALGRRVTAIDTRTFAVKDSVEVPREPRGITLSRDGSKAFVSHLAGTPLSAVELREGRLTRMTVPEVPIPQERNSGFVQSVRPQPSQAWSTTLDPQTGEVLVPFMVNRTGQEVPPEIRLDAYGSGSVSIERDNEKVSFVVGRFNPETMQWSSVRLPFGRPVRMGRESFRAFFNRPGATVRIPAASALDPRTNALAVASLGTSEIAVEVRENEQDPAPALGRSRVQTIGTVDVPSGPQHGMQSSPTLPQPMGIAFTRSGMRIAYSPFEHAIELSERGENRRVSVGEEVLPPELARGRRLFYTANDPRLSSGGLSCGGCHPDGRDDGLVWFLSHGPRQTPTLAGRLAPPFNWNGTHRTIEGNISQTVRRLGGTGLTLSEVDSIAAFVQRGIFAPHAPQRTLSAQEQRGRELFSSTGACNPCHDPGRNFTDGTPHELGGLRPDERAERTFDTPSLRYVGATGPWFHDGRYRTLRDLMTDPTHRMGAITALTPTDVDAVVAYLETL